MDSLSYKIAILLLLLITACNSAGDVDEVQNEQVSQTDILNRYLRMTFDDSISDENSFLIFLPSASCKGCNKRGIDQMVSDLPDDIADRSTIITVDSKLVPTALSSRVKTLVDQEKIMDNVRLPLANLTVVHLMKGEVVAIKSAKATDTVGVMALFVD